MARWRRIRIPYPLPPASNGRIQLGPRTGRLSYVVLLAACIGQKLQRRRQPYEALGAVSEQ